MKHFSGLIEAALTAPARRWRLAAGICAAAALSACTMPAPVEMTDDYSAVLPPEAYTGNEAGTVYNTQRQFSLFDDLRSRNIGDILTVRLIEQTQASKSATTDSSRSSSIDTGNPVIFGRTITADGQELLNTSIEADQSFAGTGSSTQSNELIGDITVTVAQVLANGNLVVRGEKWLTLNQGEEYIRISGIVRPADISPDNSVPSLRLADARITYSGKGHIANSNKPGWLQRFFTSAAWPF